jgi:hypothetical protein
MTEKYAPKPRVIIDVNKHGIRRERNVDFVKKKFKDEDELNPKRKKKNQK